MTISCFCPLHRAPPLRRPFVLGFRPPSRGGRISAQASPSLSVSIPPPPSPFIRRHVVRKRPRLPSGSASPNRKSGRCSLRRSGRQAPYSRPRLQKKRLDDFGPTFSSAEQMTGAKSTRHSRRFQPPPGHEPRTCRRASSLPPRAPCVIPWRYCPTTTISTHSQFGNVAIELRRVRTENGAPRHALIATVKCSDPDRAHIGDIGAPRPIKPRPRSRKLNTPR